MLDCLSGHRGSIPLRVAKVNKKNMYNCIIFTDITSSTHSTISIGAFKVANSLRKAGYSCLVVNHFSSYTEADLLEIIDHAVSDKTLLVGFSNTFLKKTEKINGRFHVTELPNEIVFPQGKEIENKFLDFCKQKNKNIKTVLGGAKAHINYANKNIDFVCVGYSEESIVNLMNYLSHGTDLKYAKKNLWGRVVLEDPYQTSFNFADDSFEWLPEDVLNHKTLPLEIARGCIFKCKFCSYPMNGKKDLDFIKTEKLLYSELLANYEKYGITHYELIDDTFNDNREKIDMMVRLANKLPFQPTYWGYHRLDLLATRPDTIAKLYDAGVRAMFFGIETLHSKAGRIVGKGYDQKKQIKTIEQIRNKFDISMHGSFIMGLPEEPLQSSLDTVAKLESGDIPLHSWTVFPLNISKFKLTAGEFDTNWQKYGYEEMVTQTQVESHVMQGYESTFPYLIWKNKYTNFKEVTEITNDILKNRFSQDKLYIEGQMAIEVHGMNFPGFDFETNRNTLYKDFKYNGLEKVLYPRFIKQNQIKLNTFLQRNNAGLV